MLSLHKTLSDRAKVNFRVVFLSIYILYPIGKFSFVSLFIHVYIYQGKFLLLSETTTSKHDTESITKLLLTTQAAYSRRYTNDSKLCYIIVLDLAWASIHAACTINRESFVDYNKRI